MRQSFLDMQDIHYTKKFLFTMSARKTQLNYFEKQKQWLIICFPWNISRIFVLMVFNINVKQCFTIDGVAASSIKEGRSTISFLICWSLLAKKATHDVFENLSALKLFLIISPTSFIQVSLPLQLFSTTVDASPTSTFWVADGKTEDSLSTGSMFLQYSGNFSFFLGSSLLPP